MRTELAEVLVIDSGGLFALEWDRLFPLNPGCDFPTVESAVHDYLDGRAGLGELWRALLPAWVADARELDSDRCDLAAGRAAVAAFGAALVNRHHFTRQSVWRVWVELPLLEDGKHPEWVRDVWRFLQAEIGIPA